MANYMKCVAGVGMVEMSDAEHAVRVADEKAHEDARPAKAFKTLRFERNQKLAETDHYALGDVTLSNDMKAYRKALRDLPASYNNTTVLQAITWPTKP